MEPFEVENGRKKIREQWIISSMKSLINLSEMTFTCQAPSACIAFLGRMAESLKNPGGNQGEKW